VTSALSYHTPKVMSYTLRIAAVSNTQHFALGAIFVYQLALLYRFQHGLDLNVGLKAFIKAI